MAFKPNTDDIREAPALYLIDALLEAGATVAAFDPEAAENVKGVVGAKITYGKSQYSVLDKADALIIATEWSEFRNPDFEFMEKLLKAKVLFDGRNLFDSKQMKEQGYHYESIGRP